jgi:hypothetical protein
VTKEEYEQKFLGNQKITGFGIETTMHMPCPFCAEPDFLVHTILDTQKAYINGAICNHCGRGARAIFHGDGQSIRFYFVQTVGDPPPEYAPPMRRVGP